MSAHYSPPRPAEEVAREMVPDAGHVPAIVESGPYCDWELCRAPISAPPLPGCGSPYIHANGTWVGPAPTGRVPVITRAREEGAAAALHGVAMADRDQLGREVRAVWVAWAREQPAPKPSWLVPWEGLSEPDREVDRRIGERLFAMGAAAERARFVPAMTSELRAGLAKDALRPVEFLSLEGYKAARTNVEQTIDLAYQDGFDVGRKAAAAERARQQPCETARSVMSLSEAADLWSLHTGEPVPAMPLWCSCGKPKPYPGGTLCKCLDCGGFCDLTEPEPQQPRDLAGRIREMVHTWTETWLSTADGDDATIIRVILGELRLAHANAHQGFSALGHVDFLRRRARSSGGHESWVALYSRAADELETIVRECGKEGQR